MRTRQLLFFTLTSLFLYLNNYARAQADSPQVIMNDILYSKAESLRHQNPDSSIYLFELSYRNYIEQGDTSRAIQTLIQVATINGHKANYKASYDKLWEALFLADESQNEMAKISIYNHLGRYYSFYKRKEEALRNFALSQGISRKLIEMGQLSEADLVMNYYPLCATYRELNEPELAQTYLDSCFMFHSSSNNSPELAYLKFELAFLTKEKKKYAEALEIYHEIQPWFEQNEPAYQVLVYTYMGDTYLGLENFPESEKRYKKALEISNQYNGHIDFTPLIHERLADLYSDQGNLLQAYNSLKMVKELDRKFFDSRSENNRPLMEIQDAFREKQEEVQELLKEKRLTELEHQNKVWFLQRIILLVSLLFLLIIGIIYIYYVRSKHRAEKRIIKKERELEIQKANELVELKNKELAASTLKLIEKDEVLASLKDKFAHQKEGLSPNDIKQLARSININSAQNWEEFENRFVAVNKNFYNRLFKKYPNLTQGDQKLCALIKLNFSSKDMAKLMGISVESVHTTRYRLRKKLKLARQVNLEEFIAKI